MSFSVPACRAAVRNACTLPVSSHSLQRGPARRHPRVVHRTRDRDSSSPPTPTSRSPPTAPPRPAGCAGNPVGTSAGPSATAGHRNPRCRPPAAPPLRGERRLPVHRRHRLGSDPVPHRHRHPTGDAAADGRCGQAPRRCRPPAYHTAKPNPATQQQHHRSTRRPTSASSRCRPHGCHRTSRARRRRRHPSTEHDNTPALDAAVAEDGVDDPRRHHVGDGGQDAPRRCRQCRPWRRAAC